MSMDLIYKCCVEENNTQALFDLPCHTQAVESHVKMMTEASSEVIGKAKRDQFVHLGIKARCNRGKFDNKVNSSM
jgi:hypothetical protein